MLNYENALIYEKVFLKKAVAETSTKMVVLFLINFWNDIMGLKFQYVISLRINLFIYFSLYIYSCHNSLFTIWCNYVALVSFYLYLFNLYIYLLIYLNIYLTWCYYYRYFLTLTLSRHIDWHKIELVLCILCIFFFYNFTNMK